jgi:hypothetical protein
VSQTSVSQTRLRYHYCSKQDKEIHCSCDLEEREDGVGPGVNANVMSENTIDHRSWNKLRNCCFRVFIVLICSRLKKDETRGYKMSDKTIMPLGVENPIQ